jgi:AraC family transcriptional regulator
MDARAPSPLDHRTPAAAQVRGAALLRREVGGDTLALMRPTIPEHGIGHHQHDEPHLILVLAGRYVSTAQGMPEVCDAPALVYNPPGTEHRDRFRSRDGLFLAITLPRDAEPAMFEDMRAPAHACRMPGTALALGVRAVRELATWDAHSPLAWQCLRAELASSLRDAPAARLRADALRRVLARLDEPDAPPPTVAELAALARCHPVHFARVFRATVGVAPSAYARQRRVAAAMHWLARGRTATDTAHGLGFTDDSHLHRSFVRVTGLTPGAFRRACGH